MARLPQHILQQLRTIMEDERNFPKGFLFGAATAAFQVEGAWNQDGKEVNTIKVNFTSYHSKLTVAF